MATTASEYLKALGAARLTSTLPIARYRRPSILAGTPELPDPFNNIGRFCDVRPLYDGEMSSREDMGTARTGRTWQIIRYRGRFGEQQESYHEPAYEVLHVDDPADVPTLVPISALGNLW